jgi:hypothetical protein
MKHAIPAVFLLSLAGLGGCASPGTAEDFKWGVEVPKSVDKGAEFMLLLKTHREEEEIGGVPFHYQIHWTGGSSAPLRHRGTSGEGIKVRARMVPGPATILVTCENREGLDVKVLEATVDVK